MSSGQETSRQDVTGAHPEEDEEDREVKIFLIKYADGSVYEGEVDPSGKRHTTKYKIKDRTLIKQVNIDQFDTVIVDRTSRPPRIQFKGATFEVTWRQESKAAGPTGLMSIEVSKEEDPEHPGDKSKETTSSVVTLKDGSSFQNPENGLVSCSVSSRPPPPRSTTVHSLS